MFVTVLAVFLFPLGVAQAQNNRQCCAPNYATYYTNSDDGNGEILYYYDDLHGSTLTVYRNNGVFTKKVFVNSTAGAKYIFNANDECTQTLAALLYQVQCTGDDWVFRGVRMIFNRPMFVWQTGPDRHNTIVHYLDSFCIRRGKAPNDYTKPRFNLDLLVLPNHDVSIINAVDTSGCPGRKPQ